ncbi:protein kinase [Microbacterium sp. NPDC077663]|uniref:serine/threonine-protein kinase n=1 Tax=Microbacterium sp. NPDC077663 TaxID=3364189 RepID=UPI0037CB6999
MTEPPVEPVTSGMLDGRYVLGPCVGQGGMARVYRAEDVVLGRTVAIKIMRTEAEHPAILPRARMEMSLLASLNHPSLVTLFDAKIVPGQPEYLVMEFVEGTSLAVALQDGPLDAAETAGLAVELAAGLDTVHRAGIVHRDVKPSNVLLAPGTVPGRAYWPKLADFGVAYLADSTRHTSPGTVIGTAAYLAPEQVRGEPAGPPADVYALGLLLLETITGDRAFPEASGIGRVMARLVQTPEIPAWLGVEWSGLLEAMIARDPADRPTAAQVSARARILPRDIVRPTRPTAAAVDEETQPFDAAVAVPAVATVPPLAGTATVSLRDDIPRGRRAARSARRARRTRIWLLSGAAAAIIALHIVVGALWAGGAPGTGPAPEETLTGPTTPAPADLVADDGTGPAVVTVDRPEEGASQSDTSPDVDAPAESAEPAPPASDDSAGDTAATEDDPGQQARSNANQNAKEHASDNSAVSGNKQNSGNGNGNGNGNSSGKSGKDKSAKG